MKKGEERGEEGKTLYSYNMVNGHDYDFDSDNDYEAMRKSLKAKYPFKATECWTLRLSNTLNVSSMSSSSTLSPPTSIPRLTDGKLEKEYKRSALRSVRPHPWQISSISH